MKWEIKPKIEGEFFKGVDYPPLILQLLKNRGINTPELAQQFLEPSSQNEFAPTDFKQMTEATDLLISHIKAGHKIVVCGDYDADGVTASALLVETLRVLKAEVEVFIPSRFGQGYGLSKNIIDEVAAAGAKILVTVDNGIRAKKEIAYARELGLEAIVTDHHQGTKEIADRPDCIVIDPILPDETYPFKFLCGVGVAYKLAEALIDRAQLADELKQKLKNRIWDLVAIGTVADCVSLMGENRWLVKRGLEMINAKPRLGLAELLRVAKLAAPINEWQIGWQIAPRLNAAGRLKHATAAYELLLTQDAAQARIMAADLNEQNLQRQVITEEISLACEKMINESQLGDKFLAATAPALRGQEKSWSEGVIGLVAGRVVEKYHRPAVVITMSDGKIKGSGRSMDDFDITAALEQCKDYLERYGGHKMACGFTVKNQEALPGFIKKMKEIANAQLTDEELVSVLAIDAELPLEQLDFSVLNWLNKFAPFGQDNPQPKFVAYNQTIQEIVTMGSDKQHIKLRLANIWVLGFSRAKEWQNLAINDKIDLVYTPEINQFNGRQELQARAVDLKPINQ